MPRTRITRITASLAVTTAAALALTGCGPGATHPAPTATASPSPSPVDRPLTLPSQALRTALGCPASMPVAVQHQATIRAGQPTVVVVARCVSGAGSPPSGVYVVAAAKTNAPSPARIEATLVAAVDQVDVDSVTVAGSTVRVRGLAYSGPGVPRCCPDRTYDRTWTAHGDRFVAAG